MRIHALKLQEFRCFKEIDVDFSSDVVIIYGRNGVGKTGLFDAIEFALFGSVARLEEFHDDVDYISRIGAEAPSLVRLGLRDDDSTTKDVETSWNRDTRTVGAIGGSRSWPNHRELLYTLLVDAERLGSRHEVAAVRELFRATLMLSQASIREFVDSDAERRARVFARLAGLAHIQRSKDKADSVAELASRQVDSIISQLDVDVAAQENLGARLREMEVAASARRERLGEVRPSFQNLIQAATEAGIESTDLPSIGPGQHATELRIRAGEQLRELDGLVQRLALLQSTEGSHRDRATRLADIEAESEALRRRLPELLRRTEQTAKDRQAAERKLEALRSEAEGIGARLGALQTARSAAQETARIRTRIAQVDPRHAENELRTAELQRVEMVRDRAEALAAKNAAALLVAELREKVETLEKLRQEASEYARLAEDLVRDAAHLASIEARLRSLEGAATTELEALQEAELVLAGARDASRQLSSGIQERLALLSRVRPFATNEYCPLCGVRHDSSAALAQAIERTLHGVPESIRKATENEEAARNAFARQEGRLSAVTSESQVLRKERDQIRSRVEELTRQRRVTEERAESLRLPISAEEVQAHFEVVTRQLRLQEQGVSQHDAAATAALRRTDAAAEAAAAARRKLDDLASAREEAVALLDASERRLAELGYDTSSIPTVAEFARAIDDLSRELARTGTQRSTVESELIDATATERATLADRNRIDTELTELEAEKGRLQGQVEVFRRRWQEVGGVGEPSDQQISEMRLATNTRIDKASRLRDFAEKLELADEVDALEAAKTSIQAEYSEYVRKTQALRARLAAIRRAQATAQSWIAPLAENLRTAVTRTVASHRLEIERHFRAMIPAPHLFEGIGLHHRGERLEVGVRYRGQDTEAGEPRVFLSNAQLNVLALAMFMSLGARQRWSRLRVLLLDDPIQHLDDLDAVAFLDTLRAVALGRFGGRRQIVVSTCDKSMYRLMIQKFRLIETSGARFTAISLVEGGSSGPRVHYDFGGPRTTQSRIA